MDMDETIANAILLYDAQLSVLQTQLYEWVHEAAGCPAFPAKRMMDRAGELGLFRAGLKDLVSAAMKIVMERAMAGPKQAEAVIAPEMEQKIKRQMLWNNYRNN
jgi:hypothetical protein